MKYITRTLKPILSADIPVTGRGWRIYIMALDGACLILRVMR